MKYLFLLISFITFATSLSAQSMRELQKKGDDAMQQDDYVTALSYYRKAAEQNYAAAQTAIGRCYERGFGVDTCLQIAKEWYFKAAKQKETNACFELGRILYYEDDYQAAFKFFNRGLESDNVDLGTLYCKIGLGVCYRDGKGVEKNVYKANDLLMETSELLLKLETDSDFREETTTIEIGSSINGQLAWLYYKGLGVEKSWVKAKELFTDFYYDLDCCGFWPLFLTQEQYDAMYKDLDIQLITHPMAGDIREGSGTGANKKETSVTETKSKDNVKYILPVKESIGLISLLRGGEGKIGDFTILLDFAGNLSLKNLLEGSSIMFVGQVDKIEDIKLNTSYKGTSNTMFMKKGCGYIICLRGWSESYYYRLYVTDYVLDEKNRNIGVEILYQAYKIL